MSERRLLRKVPSFDDLYVIEGTGSRACIEGSRAEMLAIALAIEQRGFVKFYRCAVSVYATSKHAVFWSPRNSGRYDQGDLSLVEADALAAEIRSTLREPT